MSALDANASLPVAHAPSAAALPHPAPAGADVSARRSGDPSSDGRSACERSLVAAGRRSVAGVGLLLSAIALGVMVLEFALRVTAWAAGAAGGVLIERGRAHPAREADDTATRAHDPRR